MADEIKRTSILTVTNGRSKKPQRTIVNKRDQATDRTYEATVNIGTSEETLSFGDVTAKYIRLTNKDATNFVKVGFSAGVYGAVLDAKPTAAEDGGYMDIELFTGATIYIVADTAACDIQVEAISG